MYNKFIVNNNQLILGSVECHFELSQNHLTTKGGGWFHLDINNRIIYLYSKSIEFGYSRKDDLIKIIQEGNYPNYLIGYQFKYSEMDSLKDAINNSINLN
jgi:hypothetical protein